MTRDEAAQALIAASHNLQSLHLSLPVAAEAKSNAYAIAYYDELAEGKSATAARDIAAISARDHTATYEKLRGDIASVSEHVALLKFLIENGLTAR